MLSSKSNNNAASSVLDRHFDGFRAPRSDKAMAMVAEVITQVQNYEKLYGLRQRRRRPADQQIFEATIAAVICDLAHHHLTGRQGKVAVTRSNRKLAVRSRYRPPVLGATFPDILDRLSAPEMGFVKQTKGERRLVWDGLGQDANIYYQGIATVIEPGPRLLTQISGLDLDLYDLTRSEDEEVIVLKGPKRSGGRDGERLEYHDTDTTNRYREQLRAINRWLDDADIDFDGPSDLGIDPNQRRLHRTFNNGSFEQGGRLWGGFWLNLKKESRRADVTIDGNSVVELDYGQMALRLLYGLARKTPPEGDLYAIPGFERQRAGVKTIINAALFSEKEQKRMPKGARDGFEAWVKYDAIIRAIREHHAPVAEHFFQGVGMTLMFEESEIMVALLLRLMEQDIVALPIHDSVLAAHSSVEEVRGAMREAFVEKTGVEPLIRVELGIVPGPR